MKRFLLSIALVIGACGGSPPPASSAPTAAPTIAPPTTAATPSASASAASEGDSIGIRIVGRLDELLTIAASGDGDATGLWANEEGKWVTDNMTALVLDPALSVYVTNILGLLQAVADGSDQTEAVATLIAMRNDIATSLGLPTQAVATPAPTPAPKPITYTKITKRTWAKIVKSPDSYTGRGYRVWACIVQFDAATGQGAFRAMASYRKEPYWYSDGVNTFFSGSEAKLEPFVQDDVVDVRVIGAGSYSYDTQNGGNTTAPTFTVSSIKRVGSC